jgi:hypothetical protein
VADCHFLREQLGSTRHAKSFSVQSRFVEGRDEKSNGFGGRLGIHSCRPRIHTCHRARISGHVVHRSDVNTFSGILPDKLGVATVSGASVVSQTDYATTFNINGMTDVSGQNFLYAGDPYSAAINKISYTGALLDTIPITGWNTSCCKEDMIWTGTQLYHAQFGSGITLIDLTTGTVGALQSQPDVVGMAYANGDIWISQWNGQ